MADDTAVNLSHKLSQDHSLVLRAQGPEAEILKLLGTIKGVERIRSMGAVEAGSVDFEIEPKQDCDVRREIFNRMSDRKWPILELSTRELTLEQIFLRLTDSTYGAAERDKLEKAVKKDLSEQEKSAVLEAVYGEEE